MRHVSLSRMRPGMRPARGKIGPDAMQSYSPFLRLRIDLKMMEMHRFWLSGTFAEVEYVSTVWSRLLICLL